MQPSLGIVTPTLNCERTIRQTLASLAPLANVVSHVVVDGGSTDGTPSILTQQPLVRVQRQQRPQGMYAAINEGIAQCSTRWIAYLNGDDLAVLDSYLRLMAIGDTCGADVVFGDACYFDADTTRSPLRLKLVAAVPQVAGFLARAQMPFSQPSAIFSRRAWETLGGFDESLRVAGDVDFFLRAYAAGMRFRYVSGIVASAFRLSAQSLGMRSRDVYARELPRIARREMIVEYRREYYLSRAIRPLRTRWLNARVDRRSLVDFVEKIVRPRSEAKNR